MADKADVRVFLQGETQIVAQVVSNMVHSADTEGWREKVVLATQGGRKTTASRIGKHDGRLWNIVYPEGMEIARFQSTEEPAIFACAVGEQQLANCPKLQAYRKCLLKNRSQRGITFDLTKGKDLICALPYRVYTLDALWCFLVCFKDAAGALHWCVTQESFQLVLSSERDSDTPTRTPRMGRSARNSSSSSLSSLASSSYSMNMNERKAEKAPLPGLAAPAGLADSLGDLAPAFPTLPPVSAADFGLEFGGSDKKAAFVLDPNNNSGYTPTPAPVAAPAPATLTPATVQINMPVLKVGDQTNTVGIVVTQVLADNRSVIVTAGGQFFQVDVYSLIPLNMGGLMPQPLVPQLAAAAAAQQQHFAQAAPAPAPAPVLAPPAPAAYAVKMEVQAPASLDFRHDGQLPLFVDSALPDLMGAGATDFVDLNTYLTASDSDMLPSTAAGSSAGDEYMSNLGPYEMSYN